MFIYKCFFVIHGCFRLHKYNTRSCKVKSLCFSSIDEHTIKEDTSSHPSNTTEIALQSLWIAPQMDAFCFFSAESIIFLPILSCFCINITTFAAECRINIQQDSNSHESKEE